MLAAFRNRIEPLFLPAHSSHKSHPLDRSVFGPLKDYFRQRTATLAHHRASAPANKQRFLLCYREASRQGCRARNVLSGFKKTGIWPMDPSKILEDREAVIGDNPPPRERKSTSDRAPIRDPNPLKTPKRSQDIRTVLHNARGHMSPSDRSVRNLLHKLEKVVDQSNVEKAQLKAEIERSNEEIRALQPQTRKRVREPASDKFASMKDIAIAEEASRKPPKRRRRAKSEDVTQQVEEVQKMIIYGLDRLHALEEMD